MRIALTIALVTLACKGDDRAAKCRAARDRMIPQQVELVEKTLASVGPDMAEKLRAEADKQLAVFKDRFVGACTRASIVDFACLEKLGAPSKECELKHAALWADVYGEPAKPPEGPPPAEEVTPVIKTK